MIVVLDTSAAVELILNRPQKDIVESCLLKADLVTSPVLYISEIANVFWKYHQFESLKKEICEELIEKSIQLIDHYEPCSTLYLEAFHLSCETRQPLYDSLFIVLARRNNGMLVSLDKRLNASAKIQKIRIIRHK